MQKNYKLTNYGLLVLAMLFMLASNSFADNKYGLKDKIQDGVILHCFDWKLSDIQAELPNIAKAGFSAVQTSPVHHNEKEARYGTWFISQTTLSLAMVLAMPRS